MVNFRLARRIFLISTTIALVWMGLSLWIDIPWIHSIADHISFPLAYLAVLGIAVIPGFMFIFLLLTIILDRTKENFTPTDYPNISILIAAYNEEDFIETTVRKIFNCDYPGLREVIVVNDGSSDKTKEILENISLKYKDQIKVINQDENRGKSAALNHGLLKASYDYIITVDADTWLHPHALKEIIKPFSHDEKVGAVAGSIHVNNPKASWVTKLQLWDYFISIASVKRQQSVYRGTLVAQGAFSAYLKDAIIEAGGWTNAVGEDIVLTWGMLKNNYLVGYASKALAFTHVPTTLKGFYKQRKRWARGLIEAFRAHPNILLKYRGLSKLNIFLNLFFPFIDLAIIFVLFPGIFLAVVFQNFLIVGPLTLLVLPLALLLTIVTYRYQRQILNKHHIPFNKNLTWFILFLIAFPIIHAPICISGYISERFSLKKKW